MLSRERILGISRAVAREHQPPLEVQGIVSTNGGSQRVELLVTIGGCHKEPCRLLLNLTRLDEADLEEELRAKFRDTLDVHLRG